MRLYINESDYIDIIKIHNKFHCQIKELNDTIFMCRGSILENKEKTFDTTVIDNEIYSQVNGIFDSLEEVIQYHEKCVFEYYKFRDEN